ncbi:MAG: hypothetical protein ACKOWM_09290, partial [Sphingomonadales bacterium]
MKFAKLNTLMIGDLLKSIFGDKTAKDRKEYWPFVEKANAAWQIIQNLSDDQLREKTRGFQAQVSQSIAALEEELTALQAQAADLNTPFDEKEKLYDQIDQMVKTIDERIEEELLVILPEAFAVVKETARRWAENGQLSVSATDFDRQLAAARDGITIDGDRAIWHSEWTAAGNK